MKNKQNAMKELMFYAGNRKWLTYSSLVFSGISAVLALMPFIYIWFMIRDVLEVAPDYSQATNLAYYGWMAVLFAALSILVYIAALMCSHISAFRVASNIKKRTLRHAVTLPVGAFDAIGSGKVRKTIDESSAATETYLAHNLPDFVGAVVTPLSMIAIMFVFDWRLGLASLFPIICAFAVSTRSQDFRSDRVFVRAFQVINRQIPYVGRSIYQTTASTDDVFYFVHRRGVCFSDSACTYSYS